MSIKKIVYVTDCVDIAANELRASMLKILEEEGSSSLVEVEPIVPVLPAFSPINANFALRLMAEHYGPGTVFLITVNAEKVRPRSLLGKTAKGDLIFIGRDTGSFDWLTRDFGCAELYNLDQNYPSTFVSFAGKYTTAPIAAKVAAGKKLSEFGKPVDTNSITRLKLPPGTIVHIDNFGMMKFTGDIGPAEENDRFRVEVNGRAIDAVYGRRMMSFDTGTWVLFPGSSYGLYELGQVRLIGASLIGASVGDIVRCQKLT